MEDDLGPIDRVLREHVGLEEGEGLVGVLSGGVAVGAVVVAEGDDDDLEELVAVLDADDGGAVVGEARRRGGLWGALLARPGLPEGDLEAHARADLVLLEAPVEGALEVAFEGLLGDELGLGLLVAGAVLVVDDQAGLDVAGDPVGAVLPEGADEGDAVLEEAGVSLRAGDAAGAAADVDADALVGLDAVDGDPAGGDRDEGDGGGLAGVGAGVGASCGGGVGGVARCRAGARLVVAAAGEEEEGEGRGEATVHDAKLLTQGPGGKRPGCAAFGRRGEALARGGERRR